MNTWQKLGYLGLTPFALCLYVSLFTTFNTEGKQGFIAYSAIILSFMAGSLWQLNQSDKQSFQQVISNVFALVAFSSLFLNQYLALAILATSYLALFMYEKHDVRVQHNQKKYMVMRFRLTLTVIVMHVIAYISW
jgi:Protein of unknown function (DUF3429)